MQDIRTNLIDTSALIKVYIEEVGSKEVRKYLDSQSVLWTTWLCFVEALGVLKARHKKIVKQEEYLKKAEALVSDFRNASISFVDINPLEFDIFNEAEKLVIKYAVDLVDAYQIVTLKRGTPRLFQDGSKTLFITADESLGDAAKKEGMTVWNCLKEPVPK